LEKCLTENINGQTWFYEIKTNVMKQCSNVNPELIKPQLPPSYNPPTYKTVMVKVYERKDLNFGYIEFGHAVKYRNDEKIDEFDIFYIDYHDPFDFIDVKQYATENIFVSNNDKWDVLKAVKEQWPVYYPDRVNNPNYPKLIQDLETIYAFFSKYKSNYVETGVNLTGYKS
jgi:hypothetical protein